MDLKITNQFNNTLLGRIDLFGTISFSGATPSNSEIAKTISEKTKSALELIVVKQIATKFSTQTATFKAVSYQDQKSKAKFEVATKHLKTIAAKKAKEAAEQKEAELEAKKKAEEEAKAAKESEAPVETGAAPVASEKSTPATEQKSE
jgi:ribosomal protein S24E